LPSPHCDSRPQGVLPSLIVLHAISLPPGEFASDLVRDLFLGCLDCDHDARLAGLAKLRVSAHCVIDRSGNLLQFVPLQQRAWHAGESCWKGRQACNDFSIGIEMIGDETTPFTDAQYHTCATLCHTIMQHFPAIAFDAIVGHQDIAPGRKWDPGRLWQQPRLDALLAQADSLATIRNLVW